MTDKEFLRKFRAAVAEFMTDPELYMGHAGLCYGLTKASEALGEVSFYYSMSKFIGGPDNIDERGWFSPTRMAVVLLLANLDDETILYINNLEYSK